MLWSGWTLEAKLLIVIGCAIVIAISILIIVCLIIPESWWSCPWTIDHVDDTKTTIQLKDFRFDAADDCPSSCKPTAVDQEYWTRLSSQSESVYDNPSVISFDSGRPGSSSNGSSITSESASLSPSSSRSDSLTTLPSSSEESSRPQIHLTFQLSETSHSTSDQLLVVTIENATELPTRSYMDAVDPSVHLRLERRQRMGSLTLSHLIGGRRMSNQSILTEDSTCPVIYRSRNPRFHHPVTLVVPKSTPLKDCQLVVKVEDKDKLVGKSELGRCRIDLRELDFLSGGWLDGRGQSRESVVRLSRFLDANQQPEERGALLVGLSFLPTSQRITVSITQCNRLIKTDLAPANTTAVVRLFLLNESGRVLKKRKTAPFETSPSKGQRIELNDAFHLDVEIERWNRCVVLLVLSHILPMKNPQQQEDRGASVSLADDRQLRIRPVYHHAGHVALGKRVAGQAERIHWNSAFQNPRRVISQWHSLY